MRRSHIYIIVLLWLFCALPAAGMSTIVEVKLPSGRTATAEYIQGKASRPAVLVLHGFLQTRGFPTVAGVAQSFSAAGYTVLSPNLSLGISQRNKSLPCEAIHTHALEDDVAEIAYWTRWLAGKTHARIVLVGHSFGNIQILSYLSQKPLPAVEKAITIALTDVEVRQSALQRAQLSRELRDRIARGDNSLVITEYGQCKTYPSAPAALLSYVDITRSTILAWLAKSPVPVETIMGSKDERMGPDWADKLRAQGIAVRMIAGANHFFDDQYEFDLQDAVLQAMDMRKREQ